MATAFAVAATAGAAEQLNLVENGTPRYAVVVPDGRPQLAVEAARLLTRIVERASGASLSVVEERAAPEGPKVLVGMTRAAGAAGLGLDRLRGQSCILRAVGGGNRAPEQPSRGTRCDGF